MPIFEYACRDCGKQFEQLLRSDEKPECPDCNGHRLEKMLSAFAVSGETDDTPFPESCGSCGNAPGSCMVN